MLDYLADCHTNSIAPGSWDINSRYSGHSKCTRTGLMLPLWYSVNFRFYRVTNSLIGYCCAGPVCRTVRTETFRQLC